MPSAEGVELDAAVFWSLVERLATALAADDVVGKVDARRLMDSPGRAPRFPLSPAGARRTSMGRIYTRCGLVWTVQTPPAAPWAAVVHAAAHI